MKAKTYTTGLLLLSIAIALPLGACTTTGKRGSTDAGIGEAGKKPTPEVSTIPARDAWEEEAVVEERKTQSELFPGTGKFINTRAAWQRPYRATATGDVTLNFQGSDIQEVVKTVLGDILQVNYAIDEKVKGQVFLQTSAPLARNSLIPVLEGLLRMKGAVLIQSEGLYRIVPESAALASAVSPHIRLFRDKGFQMLVVPLRFIAAPEMNKILEPLKPSNGVIQVDHKRNLLILAGTQVELAHLLKTIKIFDVDQLKGMSVGLFRLSAVDPETVIVELNKIFSGGAGEGAAKDKDGSVGGMLHFMPIQRLNAVLVITPQSKYLKDVQLWIERLDQGMDPAEQNLHVYYVQNARAVQIAELLNQLFKAEPPAAEAPPATSLAPGATPAVIETGPGDTEKILEGKGSARPPWLKPTNGQTGPASKVPAGVMLAKADQGDGMDVGQVTIIADDTNNALVVKATADDYTRIERAIRKLDVLPLQVLVETTIADVELKGDFSFGLEWFFKSKFGGSKSAIGLLDLGSPGLAPIVPGFSYTVVDSADVVRGVLNTLASESQLNILSSPSLMVLDNRTATIKVGDQVPVRTSEASSISTSGEAPIIASTIELRDTGVLLEVTPRVNASGLVTMEIVQEVNDPETTTTSGIDSPTINQRRIQTTVAVQSGQTIVLGGLIRDRRSKSKSGVPGLRNIPLIGWLFGNKSKQSERSELLVMITPTAIKDQNEALAVTEELKSKMTNLKALSFPLPLPYEGKIKP
ncbi:MAG: type II secretion system secretin GspD [Acidiferrobacterales bacterium]